MVYSEPTIICLTGVSGCGKSSVLKELLALGCKAIPSYSNRPPRENNEIGRTYLPYDSESISYQKKENSVIVESDKDKLDIVFENVVAYTQIYDYHYFSLSDQFEIKDNDLDVYSKYNPLFRKSNQIEKIKYKRLYSNPLKTLTRGGKEIGSTRNDLLEYFNYTLFGGIFVYVINYECIEQVRDFFKERNVISVDIACSMKDFSNAINKRNTDEDYRKEIDMKRYQEIGGDYFDIVVYNDFIRTPRDIALDIVDKLDLMLIDGELV